AKAGRGSTQRSAQDGTAAAKAMAEAKTLREAVAAQGDYARASFDSLVAESGKVSEISVKVADEALRPIRARVEVAVARMLKTAA
ncbi:MAG: phasin family protein, partial [Dongiaceae bacterium]